MAQYTLMAHQTEGVQFIEDMDGIAALLYDPGVGKTGTTLSWVDAQAKRKGEFRVLVFAPLTACDTWVLQAPPFMDSTVKARMLEGNTRKILNGIAHSGNWARVPNARVMANHRGAPTTSSRVTLLSVSAGAISSWANNDPRKEVVRKKETAELCDLTGLADPNDDKALQRWLARQSDPALKEQAQALRARSTYWKGTGQTKRQRVILLQKAVRAYKPDLIVVDESHIIKSHNSNLSEALYQIAPLAKHRLILTGTVNPKDMLDCYGQWRFLAPWTFSDQYHDAYTKTPLRMTRMQWAGIRVWPWMRFANRYGVKGGYEGKQYDGINPDTEDDLKARIAERSHVVRKEDALDLPPVTDVDIHVTLTPKEQRIYDDMRDELAAMLDTGELLEAPNALAKMMKLRQITAGFVKDTETDTVHVVGHSKQEAVVNLVNTTLVSEKRLVVFAFFKSEVAAIADRLRMKGRTIEVITGDTKNAERLAIRQRFADTKRYPGTTILVAQVKTMSLSVNELVTAQNAVFATRSGQRDVMVQARGRLDRNGQKGSKVTFWNVYCPDTVDQVIMETQVARGSMEQALLDHIRLTPRKTARRTARK